MRKLGLFVVLLVAAMAVCAHADLQGDIDALQQRIADLQWNIEGIQGAIVTLDGMINDCMSNPDQCEEGQVDSYWAQRSEMEAQLFMMQSELDDATSELKALLEQQSHQ